MLLSHCQVDNWRARLAGGGRTMATEVLRKALADHGMTVADLHRAVVARGVVITDRGFRYQLRGERPLSVPVAEAVAAVVGQSVASLFAGRRMIERTTVAGPTPEGVAS